MKIALGLLAALVALPASAAFQSSYEADSLTALYRSGGDNGAPATIAGKSRSATRGSRASVGNSTAPATIAGMSRSATRGSRA